jgi:MFS family permease
MTAPVALILPPTAHAAPPSNRVAFYLLASIVVSFIAGASAPTPLYGIYQTRWALSPLAVTVIFATYAVAVLLSLLFGGRLSDHLGRRPVLLAAIAAEIGAMAVLATAGGFEQLLVGRLVQGTATGTAVAALGAGLVDLDKRRGATANAVSPAFGTAIGGLVAGVFVQYLPAPTMLVFVVLSVVFALQAVGVYRMPETISRQSGAWASLKPQFRLPPVLRAPLLLAVPVIVAAWGLASFYGSLGPALVRQLLGTSSPLLGGLALFALAISGGISVLALQNRQARGLMAFGAAALAVGASVTVWTLPLHSVVLFFVGTVIAGMGFGTGFQGAVGTIIPHAAAHERAGVLSIVFIVSYLALAVPAVLAGLRLAQHHDMLGTAREFGSAVSALALVALLATSLNELTRRNEPAAKPKPCAMPTWGC